MISRLNRFFESSRGVMSSWLVIVAVVLLTIHAGWREWRDRPLGKPATLLFVQAEPRGSDLIVSFALNKTRDCGFTSSRWVENIATGERWYLTPGEASSVDPGDVAVKHVRFSLPPGLPAGNYAYRTKGIYECEDGFYESDPSFAPFTIPALRGSGSR